MVKAAGSTLGELCGIADRSDAKLLVEVGDPCRLAGREALPASTWVCQPDPCLPLRRRATVSLAGTASTEVAIGGINAVFTSHARDPASVRTEGRGHLRG